MDIKEILVMHHSHLDVGYTHSQPVLWELQTDFIDQALELLDETEDWQGPSQPKWTCEVTAQVKKWMETASEDDITKFKKYVAEKRIGISGMEYNTTPLSNAEQLAIQLELTKKYREELGANIVTVNQHDVDGVPWAFADVMIDSGIELLIMAVNPHLGGKIVERPSVFQWVAPSGRKIYVMNGAHYTMFDQLFFTAENRIERIEEGIENYFQYLEKKNYDYDFVYLTSANPPVCWDNAPPNKDIAKLIKTWNEQEKTPLIKYIIPEMLLEKIKTIPEEKLKSYKGDWTDYWNFGCASTAYETKININAKSKLQKAEMLYGLNENKSDRLNKLFEKAWGKVNLFDEHTWGAFNSMDHDSPFVQMQINTKKQYAHDAHELAEYLLVNSLETLTENEHTIWTQDGVLVLNNSPIKRSEYIKVPDWWTMEGKRLRTARYAWPNRVPQMEDAPSYGPFEIEPYSYRVIKIDDLGETVENSKTVKGGDSFSEKHVFRLNIQEADVNLEGISYIESDIYKIDYNKNTGRILSVHNKKNDWQLLDAKSDFTFFEFVKEEPDPLIDNDRTAYYARDLEKEKFDEICWRTNFKTRYTKATKPLGTERNIIPGGVELILKFEAPGFNKLEQHIILKDNSELIEIKLVMDKKDVHEPEGIYFVTPLNITKDWQCQFDSASIPVKLDEEQLPDSSKGWVTVETFLSMFDENNGVTLYCPDAPMVMAGDFNFGRKHKLIERNENPLLLAWPLNNYWDTNFAVTQPGHIELTYFLNSFSKFDLSKTMKEGQSVQSELEVYQLMEVGEKKDASLIKLSHDDVKVVRLSSKESDEVLITLLNMSSNDIETELELKDRTISKVYMSDSFGDKGDEISIKGKVILKLKPKQITNYKIVF